MASDTIGTRRWRWVARFALALAAVVALGLAFDRPPRVQQVPAGATESACIRTGPIDTVEQLNTFVGSVRGDPGFAGGDVGASVRLQDGRELFVFGDTLRGMGFRGQSFVHNSMLVFAPGCGRVVMPADHGALIPDRSDGVGYWPMSVARVGQSGYDLVGVSVQRVRPTGGTHPFAFEILGPAGALFRVPRGGTPQLIGLRDFGPDGADTTSPMWGAAVVVDGDWVYLYGTSRSNGATVGGFALRVARVRISGLLDRNSWRYWDGRSWGTSAGAAAVVIPARGGVSQTLSVYRAGDRWYAVSKRDEVLGSDLTIWVAHGPAGPFVASPDVVPIPSDPATGELRYMPLAHPDLLPIPGTVVVSYSQNNANYTVIENDPRRYRPRFLRMPLPR